MDPERRERFSMQAALALGITAFFACAALCLAPVEFFRSIEERTRPDGSMDMIYGPMLAFAFLAAMLATLVAGLLAWVGWKYVLLPAGRLGFVAGALAGVPVAVLTTFAFVVVFAEEVWQYTGLLTTELSLPAAGYFVIFLALSIPAALLGGLVGGVVGSAQLLELVGGNERRLPPVRG